MRIIIDDSRVRLIDMKASKIWLDHGIVNSYTGIDIPDGFHVVGNYLVNPKHVFQRRNHLYVQVSEHSTEPLHVSAGEAKEYRDKYLTESG